ncbi:MAG: UvrB/UvrC motif-containing protein [bacterium]
MLCQDCDKREAQVHLTQIINNEKTSLSLCRECAAARGFHSPLEKAPFPLAEILSGLAFGAPPDQQMPAEDMPRCESCGTSFEDFARQGRFGCAECYRAFRPRLEAIMRKIHGASLHRGKTPEQTIESRADTKVRPISEERRLETELQKAVQGEEFERAAEIRDKLRMIRSGQPVD